MEVEKIIMTENENQEERKELQQKKNEKKKQLGGLRTMPFILDVPMPLETMESERNMSENAEEKRRENELKKKKLGGVKTLPFILANEISERFATAGLQANMITYLTQQLNLPLVKGSNIISNYAGTAGFTPLIGALIADSYVGRYWMIVIGSIIYELGMGSIILSAVLPGLRPPPCPTQINCKEASGTQLHVLYASLLFTSLGLGGIRPCVVTFGADQVGMTKEEIKSRSWNFFNWYYFCLEVATLSALTFLVYFQDHVGWGWGLGIPAISMTVSIIIFIIGSPYYKKEKPEGSPLVRLAQVTIAAIRKRKAVAPKDPMLLYNNRKLDAALTINGRLVHTNELRWFDQAAIVTDGDKIESSPPNLWRLSTVHRVEELKSMVRMLPIWAAGILAITAYSHQDSFSIQQARTLDRRISHSSSFKIPPASMAVFEIFTVLTGLMLYDRVFVPLVRRFTKNQAGITCLQRIGIGFGINVLGTVVSALVEIRRKSVAAQNGLIDKPTATLPMSVFWLVPQYSLHGIAIVFFSVGRLEFFYDQSPESMRSTSASFFWVANAIGSYLGTMMVSWMHKYTPTQRNWIPNRNLNKGRLEYYWWFVSGLQVINLIYFCVCAKFYTYKKLEEVSELVMIDEGDVELAAASATDDQIPTSSMPESSDDVNGNTETKK